MSASDAFAPHPLHAPAAILGDGVVVTGEIHSNEPLTIVGKVDGSIYMPDHRLTITANGRVRAKVTAREIEVHGLLDGQAQAKEIMCIRKGAEITGDIHSPRIVIEDGAFIKGKVEIPRPHVSQAEASTTST
jgi:cytoskeletal protein CcmA (bactofilin family)